MAVQKNIGEAGRALFPERCRPLHIAASLQGLNALPPSLGAP